MLSVFWLGGWAKWVLKVHVLRSSLGLLLPSFAGNLFPSLSLNFPTCLMKIAQPTSGTIMQISVSMGESSWPVAGTQHINSLP